jgi:signal transduction histidine kinase
VPVVERTARLLDRCQLPPTLADTALAAVVGAVTLIAVLVQQEVEDQPLTAGGVALIAVQVVPLVWRRRAPVGVAVVSITAAVIYGIAELPDPPLIFGPLLALYTVAAYRPRSVSLPFAALVMLGAAVGITLGRDADAADIAVGYFSGITAWVIGDTTRGQRERAVWLEERREEAARQAASDERIRIARDLHDIVAHHVSVIAVQAEAAQEVLAARPDRAADAMATVADTARTALTELRRLLGVLRSDGAMSPQPDLATIDELVESVRRTGLPVAVHTTGDERPIDAVVGLTAYRVVQEALTNVLKHAGASRAEVGLDFADDALVVSVVDDGAKPRRTPNGLGPSDGGGQGLVGMRERVAVLGGSLDAGPGTEGGFAVRARLPLRPDDQA